MAVGNPVGVCSQCGGAVMCVIPSRLVGGYQHLMKTPAHYACESCHAQAAMHELPLPVIPTYHPERSS